MGLFVWSDQKENLRFGGWDMLSIKQAGGIHCFCVFVFVGKAKRLWLLGGNGRGRRPLAMYRFSQDKCLLFPTRNLPIQRHDKRYMADTGWRTSDQKQAIIRDTSRCLSDQRKRFHWWFVLRQWDSRRFSVWFYNLFQSHDKVTIIKIFIKSNPIFEMIRFMAFFSTIAIQCICILYVPVYCM